MSKEIKSNLGEKRVLAIGILLGYWVLGLQYFLFLLVVKITGFDFFISIFNWMIGVLFTILSIFFIWFSVKYWRNSP